MTKSQFIHSLNTCHKEADKLSAIGILSLITRISTQLSSEIIKSAWNCSNSTHFGNNIYRLIECSADGETDLTFTPKLKKGCTMYTVYLDEHTAAFALFKIKKHINNG